MEYKSNEMRFLNHPPAAAPFSIDQFLSLSLSGSVSLSLSRWQSYSGVYLPSVSGDIVSLSSYDVSLNEMNFKSISLSIAIARTFEAVSSVH